MKNKSLYIDYLVLAIVVVIAYWQVSLCQFTVKNDTALLSFPWKKFVSDSLRSGYFPIWNPYINLGWTQGMEPSTWYYPSWIFALFGKFNLSFLHIEITLHLILGAIGIYKLLSLLKLNRWALIHGSLVYILSGFFIGNFQHLGWTYYACWLPLVLYYLFNQIKKPGTIVSIKLGFSASMMALCGYIPFTATTVLFIVGLLLIVFIKKTKAQETMEVWKLAKNLFVATVVILLICSPAIYMLWINADTMYRGGKYSDQSAAFGSLVPMSWINLVFPFASTAKSVVWEGTDISMNNIFIGWMSFLFLGLAYFEKEKRKIFLLVSVISILALCFSFGKYCPPTWFVFRHLPFYEKLRFAAQFRLYFIFGVAILVAIGTQYLLKHHPSKKVRWFIVISGLIFLILAAFNNNQPFLKYFNAVFVQEKNIHTVWQSALFQSLLWGGVCIILALVHFLSRQKPSKVSKQFIVFNVIILIMAVQMNMFYTGVANIRVADIEKQVVNLPEDFIPIPNLTFYDYFKPGVGLTWINTGGLYHVPNNNCYHPYNSKNYGDYLTLHQPISKTLPLIFTNAKMFEDLAPDQYAEIKAEQATDSVQLTPYNMKFVTKTHFIEKLYIQVSKTPATKVYINDKEEESKMENSLLVLNNVKPNSKVTISFLPPYAKVFAWLGGISFFTGLLLLCIHRVLRRFRPI